jgi:transposase
MSELASEARRHRQSAQKAEREVEQQGKCHDAVRRMATVVGQTTSAVLVAKMHDPRAYPAAAAYVKGMGLNLKVRSSGKHKGQLKITKRGRQMCGSICLWQHCAWSRSVETRWCEPGTCGRCNVMGG